MISKYKVWTAFKLPTGDVAVSGSVNGSLSVGHKGVARVPFGDVEVIVVGIGVSDRNIGPPDRQGLLIRISLGELDNLIGATIEFNNPEP